AAGNGNVVSERRAIPAAFSGVGVGSGIHATVVIGKEPSAVLTGDANLLKMIRLEVQDGKLVTVVDCRGGLRPTRDIQLAVVATELHDIDASGGATVIAQASPGDTFEADASGGAKVIVQPIASEQ